MVIDQVVMGQMDVFARHYHDEASKFFNQPEVLDKWVSNLKFATQLSIAGLIAAMAIVMLGVWKVRYFSLLLVFVPALLPMFFVLDYAGWLWFFGHNLHPWGAFTVKPFMPTVFGEGKVAQFSTYSYPYYGYAMLVVASVAAMLALLMRRKLMRENPDVN
jgi:TRAP-type mannitol/chloroaromatic compound transport system permease large subunit